MVPDHYLSKNQTMRQRAVSRLALSPSLRYGDQGSLGFGVRLADVVRFFVLFIRARDCLFQD
jgi:hypothetical protein